MCTPTGARGTPKQDPHACEWTIGGPGKSAANCTEVQEQRSGKRRRNGTQETVNSGNKKGEASFAFPFSEAASGPRRKKLEIDGKPELQAASIIGLNVSAAA